MSPAPSAVRVITQTHQYISHYEENTHVKMKVTHTYILMF